MCGVFLVLPVSSLRASSETLVSSFQVCNREVENPECSNPSAHMCSSDGQYCWVFSIFSPEITPNKM